ncbi:hypothetical protein BN440_1211 [Erwinia amylovora MR1]|nr:hypothetical protein BN440_1211 [Erwinia amylovora MR1]
MNLSGFNKASAADAQRAVAHCVALPDWAASLVAAVLIPRWMRYLMSLPD